MLSPDGVYMINIIDVYESDAVAEAKAEARAEDDDVTRPPTLEAAQAPGAGPGPELRRVPRGWVKTAKLTFPHIYIFGTDEDPGAGLRETFVVVASKKPLDLEELGSRDDDPKFSTSSKASPPRLEAVRRQGPQGDRPPLARDHPDRRLRPRREPAGPRRRDPGRRLIRMPVSHDPVRPPRFPSPAGEGARRAAEGAGHR